MNKQQRMIGNDYYEFVNVNPKGKLKGDCVIRAIALACGQSWEQTIRELTELGIKKGLVCNDVTLYPKYLESKGFKEMNEPRDVCNRKMSVREFINEEQLDDNQLTAIVMNVGSHHVSCIMHGKVNDIWDCSRNTMHKYWYKRIV